MAIISIVGIVLAVLIVCDAAVTVLHPDAEGAIAMVVRRSVWRPAAWLSTRFPFPGQSLLGLAGPLILMTTFLAWLTLLTLALSLAVWPMLPGEFQIEADLHPLTFLDALYFTAGTVTVLGYGELTPLSAEGQLVSVAGAAVGFTLFTSIATYAIEVVGGVAVRNRFSLAVHDEIQDRDGITAVIDSLADTGASETRAQWRRWAEHLREVDEMVHRYPLVAFTYRSKRKEYDPETALRHMGESTVAALLASRHDPSLRASAQTLAWALSRLQGTVAETYLGHGTRRALSHPRPTEEDRRAVERVERLLSEHLGEPDRQGRRSEAEQTVYRCRVFLEGLHRWSHTRPPAHRWDSG
ncbi:potassium channel family protein [Nocardiopsis ganjiahuensis]|uniref:potassium channel family protein n=1 Tax=Nocardiopsis ganjiahuensis TaxID=239984 RepID=UPI0003487F19|nr:potassium channel family protein [Nocardiopsis ganjiahuensis]